MVEDRNGCYLLRLRCISIPPVSSLLALLRVAHTISPGLLLRLSPRHVIPLHHSSLLIQLSRSFHIALSLSLSLSLSFPFSSFSLHFLFHFSALSPSLSYSPL